MGWGQFKGIWGREREREREGAELSEGGREGRRNMFKGKERVGRGIPEIAYRKLKVTIRRYMWKRRVHELYIRKEKNVLKLLLADGGPRS